MVTAQGVRIPQLNPAPRFEPVFVTDEDLEDLSTFFGLSKEACLKRLKEYSRTELAERWHRMNPQTLEEIMAFYRTADLYVWELMQWHASPGRRSYWATLAHLNQDFPPGAGYRRVLDYGCGIATDSLYLASRGYDVTLMDVDGPGFRFAQHRFARRRLAGRFVESRGPLPEPGGRYDVVVCFDVFEHLPEPLTAAKRLADALRPGGLMVLSGDFSDDGTCPCHLHTNLTRFGGIRWHLYLTGLGLRNVSGRIYRRASGITRLVQRWRFLAWRATGLWVSWVKP